MNVAVQAESVLGEMGPWWRYVLLKLNGNCVAPPEWVKWHPVMLWAILVTLWISFLCAGEPHTEPAGQDVVYGATVGQQQSPANGSRVFSSLKTNSKLFPPLWPFGQVWVQTIELWCWPNKQANQDQAEEVLVPNKADQPQSNPVAKGRPFWLWQAPVIFACYVKWCFDSATTRNKQQVNLELEGAACWISDVCVAQLLGKHTKMLMYTECSENIRREDSHGFLQNVVWKVWKKKSFVKITSRCYHFCFIYYNFTLLHCSFNMLSINNWVKILIINLSACERSLSSLKLVKKRIRGGVFQEDSEAFMFIWSKKEIIIVHNDIQLKPEVYISSMKYT